MAQHDQVIDNATGAAVRTDINAALAALFSSSSGPVEPLVKVPGQLWFDNSGANPILKIRNAANTGWITLATVSLVDIGVGFRTGPDRWVVNEKADMTGRDYLAVADANGYLSTADKISMLEVDGSTRAVFQAGIGADPGTLTATVHDAAGTEQNKWQLIAAGFNLAKGAYRFFTTVLRGAVSAETALSTGNMTVASYTSGGAQDGALQINALGSNNYFGSFNQWVANVRRADFGWDGNGAFIRHRDASGNVNANFYVKPDAAYYGANIIWDTGRVPLPTAGSKIFDTGWFPAPAGANSVVDFPIGTDVFATNNDAGATNRNTTIGPRAGAVLRYYNVSGSETLLSGTWVSCGSISWATNSWMCLCRRVA